MNIQALKGFRDFLPQEAKKRDYVLSILKKVFTSYGFEPLETPALEYEEILTGKYGDEGDKLMYRFEDNGKRKVAMRYDQTVPLARVVAQYQNEITFPFKRYQIQNVWRAENTQKGRYREFLQVDADIVGSYSLLSDAEIITLCAKSLEQLGIKNYKILINDRKSFSGLSKNGLVKDQDLPKVIRALDKIKKIGKEGVLEELIKDGFPSDYSNYLVQSFENLKPSSEVLEIIKINQNQRIKNVEFLPTLARGLNYYTGMIFEVEVEGYDVGSIAGGGRYDNLIGMFAGKEIPAVGFAFGFDRLIEAMEELDLFPKNLNSSQILVAFASSDLQEKAMNVASQLRNKNINAEYYLEDAGLDKQLKYANKKQIPFVLIVGEKLELKDMETGEQKEVNVEQLPDEIK